LQLSGLCRITDQRNRQHLHFEKRKTAVAVTTDGLLVIISKPPSFCEELTSSNVG
jgi:hypothetical protein